MQNLKNMTSVSSSSSSPLDHDQNKNSLVYYYSTTADYPLASSSRLFPTSGIETSYPYDAWILAGGRLFRAHAHILGAHSPYLKASIRALGEARLLLPHIPSAGFSAILSYMYTGRLSLAQAPLYETLWTGQLLQMPEIVSLCQTVIASSSVMHGASSPQVFAPRPQDPPSPKITDGLSQTEKFLAQAASWHNVAKLMPATRSSVDASLIQQPTLIRPMPTRPFRAQIYDTQSENTKICSPAMSRLLTINQYATRFSPSFVNGTSSNSQRKFPGEEQYSNVILDVAACDGPVFFERVVNKAFKYDEYENASASDDAESEINVVDTNITKPQILQDVLTSLKNKEQPPTPTPGGGSKIYHCVYCNNNFKSHYCYQKHMRRHINPITIETVDGYSKEKSGALVNKGAERSQPTTSSPTNTRVLTAHGEDGSSSMFEHEKEMANRDLSSPKPNEQNYNETGSPATSGTEEISLPSSSNSKLRVLELNVQYFPCKICGSKFPSYYFVHKHRRMCHREEPDESGTPTSTSCDSIPNNNIGGDFEEKQNSSTNVILKIN